MSSESYLARWSAYLNSFNNKVDTDNLELDKPQADESVPDNLNVEKVELDDKLADPGR